MGWQENLDSLTKPPQSQLKGHSPCACAWPVNRNHHIKVQVPANTYNFFEGVREWQVFQFLWQEVPDVKNRLYICQLNSPSSQLYLVFYFYQLTCTALQEKQHPRLQNCRRAKWALPSGLKTTVFLGLASCLVFHSEFLVLPWAYPIAKTYLFVQFSHLLCTICVQSSVSRIPNIKWDT